MKASVTRAAVYAIVSLIAVTAPILKGATLVGFAMLAITASVLGDGTIFRILADPAERRTGRLIGLTEFTSVGSLLAAGVVLGMLPTPLFVGVVLLTGFGYLGAELARVARSDRLTGTIGFITVGFFAYAIGHGVGLGFTNVDVAVVGFLSMAGALGGALVRAATWSRHDGLVMAVLVVGLGGLYALPSPSLNTVLVAIVVSTVLAYLALWIGAASVPGMVTGVLLVFLTIVLGGVVWVSMLVAFFVIGGLATKFRYEEKRMRGVAEPNRGARGTGNVLGNTAVAIAAVLGHAAVPGDSAMQPLFLFAFAGAIATALSDTLSSEIGGLYDRPMLITSFDRVAPGTNGAISLEGTLAGAAGGAVIGGLFMWLHGATLTTGVVIGVAGIVGMLIDSLLGAMFEGRVIGNHAVNAVATTVGAALAAGAHLVGVI